MKVSKLNGGALDYWVGRAEGRSVAQRDGECYEGICARYVAAGGSGWLPNYSPSTNWTIAGDIIERAAISLEFDNGHGVLTPWCARSRSRSIVMCDSRPLAAAMRCYVASAFGWDVPDEVPE